jgi:hypothetical protein
MREKGKKVNNEREKEGGGLTYQFTRIVRGGYNNW